MGKSSVTVGVVLNASSTKSLAVPCVEMFCKLRVHEFNVKQIRPAIKNFMVFLIFSFSS